MGWALLSDVDINSEHLRYLGGLRFDIYAFYRIANLVRYPGKLTFSFNETKLPPLDKDINGESFQVIEGDFLNALFVNIPYIS